MGYNPDKHHRRSIRLQDYDYAQEGAYFVTIVAHNRECLFGDVANGEIVLNEIGNMVIYHWNNLTQHYPCIDLDAFVVMPNHIHAIVALQNESSSLGNKPTLGRIIGTFKSFSAREINILRNTQSAPVWQRNYYEKIIRSEEMLNAITEYINLNPAKWVEDAENPANFK